jgi:hypothetical protein
MKHFIATTFLGVGFCSAALAGPSPIYQNYGVVTQAPVVDAVTFLNAGDFEIDTVSSYSLTNLNNIFGNGYSVLPFMTKDTLYFTNTSSGLMLGESGFEFGTTTSTSRHGASFFFNAGTVAGVDTEALIFLYSVPGATVYVPAPADSQPIPSQVLVMATNIINTGVMSVGDYGLLRLVGNNVTNAYGTLTAGAVDRTGLSAQSLTIGNLIESTGLQGQYDWDDAGGQYYFEPSPGVYDVFWGVTNGENIGADEMAADLGDMAIGFPALVPSVPLAGRDMIWPGEFPLNYATAQWSVSAIGYIVNATNVYYNIIFVNTNFADTNLSAAAGFSDAFDPQDTLTAFTDDPYAYEAIVQFSERVYDVVTGDTVTNGVYLMDDGAYLPSMVLADNASLPDGYSRPNAFELTTLMPSEWADASEFTAIYGVPFDPGFIYTPGQIANRVVPFEISEYGAQIGRNPADLLGSFSSLFETNLLATDYLDYLTVNLLDPTNEPGRIEIDAGNLDITQARLRAEGMVILNVTNLGGGSTAGVDWGEVNANIGATNGSLIVSNLFPTTFHRVRGDIYAWSATWENNQTNSALGPVTNTIHYHVLVVDQNLFGTFPSTVRNLKLTGKKSIVLQDNLNIINQAVINTTNLTINSSNYFSQSAQDFTPVTTPYLQNLLITTNGILDAYSTLDVGFNLNQGQAVPATQKYTVNTITNFGQMIATAPVLQSRIFENDGGITSDNGGSIVIEADNLGLGLAAPTSTNFLSAEGNVSLSANDIQARSSIITAGIPGYEAGSLTLYAPGRLTDFVSGTPAVNGTNVLNVITNRWIVYGGGFSLPVKPADGDLFGTEITTSVTNFEQATHIWAGNPAYGATLAGFSNNVVIGRLVLDRQSSNSILHFSAAGTSNAMYVDHLELTNYAYKDYRHGLYIDGNFTIYFADCNGDPAKLMDIYPRLVWVHTFAGPNSTQVVIYTNQTSSNLCWMNAALADSLEISFFTNGVPNYYNQPFVLNNPITGALATNFTKCPYCANNCSAGEAASTSILVATPAPGGGRTLTLVNIAVNGEGSISPALKQDQVALGKSYTLTATPSNGWLFNGWTAVGLSNAVNTQSPVLKFALLTDTAITANFIPNPFIPLHGVYNGLFFQTNGVAPGSSGAFTLTLAKSGSFSGRLLMGPSAYSFNSQFSTAGAAQVEAKDGAKSLALNLQLDATGQSGRIYGDVNGGSWDALLAGDLAPVWTAKNPSPLAGRYTMVLPWGTGTVSKPGGDSYGVVTVNTMGVLTAAGALADGTAFSASAPLSKSGQWPFYAYAAAGKDEVVGWVSFGANGPAGANVCWSKAAGFTNDLQLTGSIWQAPAAGTPALNLTSPAVVLTGGDLPGTLTDAVALRQYVSYAATNVSLTINPSAGSFSGWFVNPGTGRKVTMSGVILQNQDSGRGFFLGTNESGAVLLQEQ